jgi:predicted nucleic-acid-binding protein
MKALDTNILVRFLVRDDERQAKRVLALFREAESTGDTFFIPIAVILELIWVLEAAYDCGRQEILEGIEQLTMMPILQFEQLDVLHRILEDGRACTIDLSDLLIAHSSFAAGCKNVITFDKRASKHRLFVLP